MASQSWIHGNRGGDRRNATPSKEPRLFSHGILAAGVVAFNVQGVPSMEPWSFSHGYLRCKTPASPCPAPFNGAMASQPWIRVRPRIYTTTNPSLQRSRDLSAMDIAAVVWDEDAEPVVTGEAEQQRAGNFARKLYLEIERSTSV